MTPTPTDRSRTPRTSARRRRMGQHFLRDRRVLARLLALIDPQPGDLVLEIGPGRGALTVPLLERVRRLHAVELDARLARELVASLGASPAFSLSADDVLDVDPEDLRQALAPAAGERVRVVGNLPYSVATAVIRRLLPRADLFRDMVVMVQEEVAGRLVAGPDQPDYGALSVEVALYAEARAAFGVRPAAFSPPPAVNSRVVVLSLRETPDAGACRRAARLAREAFGQRRKTLLNALKGAGHDAGTVREALDGLGLTVRTRAQELPAATFVALAARLGAAGREEAG